MRCLRPGTDAELLGGASPFDLGDIGYGAGDPDGLAFDIHGNLIVALAGVDEVAITASPNQGPKRIVVGRRPTAVAPAPMARSSMSPIPSMTQFPWSRSEPASGWRPSAWALGPSPRL